MSLAAATRALFGVSIHDKPRFSRGERQIKQSNCLWKDDMNLKDLLDREFPTSQLGDHLSGRFKERLVSLRNLVRHADVDIVWTKHLPDHLLLSYAETKKTLSVFDLPSLIEISYEACERVDEREANTHQLTYYYGDRLVGGLMFSAEFMLETLQTYRLLVPHRDFKWARRTFLSSARGSRLQYLAPWKKAHQQASDQRLAEISSFWHHEEDAGTRLTTYSQMFKRFPHWGLRIQNLMEEAEDPTPMTWSGRWAERRKGPRHAFWVTVIAFVVASLFGTIAMALGIVQFWVAWCDWDGAKAKICNPRGENKTDEGLRSDVFIAP
ncbi:hypothetical protein LX36DRAFT_581275 [Colletotrichum falcatum]|nr:hypothetical protein LX36DRAFT_581275 [Colletotrichum falcatum]